jgi:hypothetical protein
MLFGRQRKAIDERIVQGIVGAQEKTATEAATGDEVRSTWKDTTRERHTHVSVTAPSGCGESNLGRSRPGG